MSNLESVTPYLSNAKNSVLVLIDLQDRLFSAMPEGVRDRVIEQANILLKVANRLAIPVIVTEQYPKGLGKTAPAIQEHLLDTAMVVEKTSFSCANDALFKASLEKADVKQVILTGMETHICVLQTAIQLQEEGYQVFVVEDAVSSRAKANQYNAIQRLRQTGVIITNVESILFEWVGDAKHPDFKTLASLII
jgi:nicotinamidase-related amidase